MSKSFRHRQPSPSLAPIKYFGLIALKHFQVLWLPTLLTMLVYLMFKLIQKHVMCTIKYPPTLVFNKL